MSYFKCRKMGLGFCGSSQQRNMALGHCKGMQFSSKVFLTFTRMNLSSFCLGGKKSAELGDIVELFTAVRL